jgi:uncharacterized spore protein YtfJ
MANIVQNLAQQVTSVGARASYGDPVSIDGVEIVPVSLVWFGFGGGSDNVENGGGGGGGASIPIGAYVRGPAGATFKPNPAAVLAVLTPIAWAASWAVAAIALGTNRRHRR